MLEWLMQSTEEKSIILHESIRVHTSWFAFLWGKKQQKPFLIVMNISFFIFNFLIKHFLLSSDNLSEAHRLKSNQNQTNNTPSNNSTIYAFLQNYFSFIDVRRKLFVWNSIHTCIKEPVGLRIASPAFNPFQIKLQMPRNSLDFLRIIPYNLIF